MNERIKVLWKQAESHTASTGELKDRFAELIVKECCEFIEQGHHSMVDRLSLSKNIKEYFGVE